MSLTPEDWKAIEKQLSHAWASVELVVDGYQIHLTVVSTKPLHYVIAVYIGGWIRGEWSQNDCEERRRFYRSCTFFLNKPKLRAAMKKANTSLSKKALKKLNIEPFDPDKKGTYYTPYWPSAKPLIAHLKKNNTDIEWVNRPKTLEEKVKDAGLVI